MVRQYTLTALCLLPLMSYTVLAEDTEKKPEYTASAELGFLYKTGNTKSADIKAGFNVQHEKDKWRTVVAFNILAKKLEKEDADGNEEFETTDNKWDILTQTNYTIGKKAKNYLYGNLAHEQDKFSGFESQSSFSAGWGRQWYKTETSSFFADIGPGVKYDVTRATDTDASISNTSFIIQAQALYTRKLNEHVKFKQYLVAKQATQSGENSVYKSETSVTAQLIDSLQLKFALRIDYDTEVEPEFEKTNTETSMTLIYSF
jgi:putative salt-induced outer membrane protein|tara:strand:- start:8173 stop:8952 length:780 start_codon:yes stop_codon:yes gene_type:complete